MIIDNSISECCVGHTNESAITPAIGVELHGVDVSGNLPQSLVQRIKDGLRDRLVVRLRGQKLSDPELIAFSRLLGELDPPGPNPYGAPFLPEFPELNVISNVVENGRPIGNLGAGEAVWHADLTYINTPPQASVLYSLEIPLEGGATYFANMNAAYEALPTDLKERIGGMAAMHDASLNSAGMLRRGYKEVTDPRQTVGAQHPIVWTNPETGRKSLFLGRRKNSYVLGLPLAESEALLDDLWDRATKSAFVMKHEWQVGDILIWNNLCTLHRRDPFDSNARRVLHRTQIRGTLSIN
jgi:taurine dioxygenase